MYLCYLDESGTSSIPGNTSHFVLAGLSIPIWHWKDCDRDIATIKNRYKLSDAEIHIAWLLRPYSEQIKVANFKKLNKEQRIYEVEKLRREKILELQKQGNSKRLKQTKKNFKKTAAYIHLTHDERKSLVREIAHCVSRWGFARLFAECVDKVYFDPNIRDIDEQAFEQVVSRFEKYLQIVNCRDDNTCYGLLIHDNNETVAKKHTNLMKTFHQRGTLWVEVIHIIETPLFVDSQLTSMIQVADLCAYAIRRYLENGEEELFDLLFERADRKDEIVVGVRHFSAPSCKCKICVAHKK